VAQTLHEWIIAADPDTKHSIKWAQPVYENGDGPFAFMRSAKKHFTLGFWRGHSLSDPNQLLEGDGDKMKHFKIKHPDLPESQIKAWIAEAIELNRTLGNPTR
jgi:hypothetical protein